MQEDSYELIKEDQVIRTGLRMIVGCAAVIVLLFTISFIIGFVYGFFNICR